MSQHKSTTNVNELMHNQLIILQQLNTFVKTTFTWNQL